MVTKAEKKAKDKVRRLSKQDERNDKIIADYKLGYDLGQLGRKYKLTANGVSWILIKAGVRTGVVEDYNKYKAKHS